MRKTIFVLFFALSLGACIIQPVAAPTPVPAPVLPTLVSTLVSTLVPTLVPTAATIRIIDGDTIEIGTWIIRLLGIDAPELGTGICADLAITTLEMLTATGPLTLVNDSLADDQDRYGRLLRYVENNDGVDVGKALVIAGLADAATYSSTTGYPYDREPEYLVAQGQLCGEPTSVPTPTKRPLPTSKPPTQNVYYANCAAARAAGVAPIYSGQPGYRAGLDRDKDGIACE